MKKYNKKMIFFIIFVLILVDQISKYIFFDLNFMNNNYFIHSILNTGISWGIKIFHFSILVIIIPIIMLILTQLWRKKEISNTVFILILAGGIGNYIDRIIYYGVRDFIDFHIFPIFNVADIYISIGFAILVYEIVRQRFVKNQDR